MTEGSNWFQDPVVLTAEVKRAHTPRAGIPVIAGYDELREIARGGQGIVYRGVQRSTHRQVGIKVLVDGALASGAARRRFEREIDLIAGLKHPSIVSVYDSGVTEDGRLYLVMEYIDGEPLDDAVGGGSKSAMPVEETIELFASVCDAVQFAHQRGVIHRDLKPSNIRVDKAGLPHILDFGLAKLKESEAPGAERSVLSVSGQFMGSLPWASPEQASGDPDRADTRSDVYSLGVILYQLLTGRFPYDVASGLRSTLDNIMGAVPEPPSRFRADINDEVATIVARCLAKEPERRYQSAGDLARDLRHYLAGEPIEAKRDSAWYTVRKQLRRYRLVAGAAAAFVLVVCAALIVSIWLYRDASRERDEAHRQSERAQATSDFLLDTLGAVDPDKDGHDVKVLDLLDRAAQSVDSRYAGKEDLRATVHATLRGLYLKLGQLAQAQEQGRAAAEVLLATRGPDDPLTLSAQAEMAMVQHKSGHSAEAEPELRRVLELQRRVVGPFAGNTLTTQTWLAQTLKAQGKFTEAETLLREGIAGGVPALGEHEPTMVGLFATLAPVLDDLGKLDEAERMYLDVLERQRRLIGPTATETRTTIGNLVVLMIKRGRLAEAEPLAREQLKVSLERVGPEHPDTLTNMNNLAKLLQDEGNLDEAEQIWRQTLDIRLRVLGEEHPHTLATMSNLGTLLGMRGHDDLAEPLLRRALDIRLRTVGEQALDTAISMNNLAGPLQHMGKLDEAESWYRRAVEATDKSLPAGHWINAVFRCNHAKCLTALGRYQEAESLLLPAIERLRTVLGDSHAHTIKARRALVELYLAWDKPDLAAAAGEGLPPVTAPAK